MNRSKYTVILATILFAGCSQELANETDLASSEAEQTFGAREFPEATIQRVDPGDVVDYDRNVECHTVIDPEDVVPPRTIGGLAREACKNQAVAQCTESEVGGVAGVVIYAGALMADCDDYDCTTRGVVKCLYNIGSN
jgi:hypothetical protein